MEAPSSTAWPELPIAAWSDTAVTLHLWTQIVGKVRLALAPHVNHWWQVPLYVDVRGLTTGAVPYPRGALQIEFDFLAHELVIQTDAGASRRLALRPRSVAAFYTEFTDALHAVGIEAHIWPWPVEIADPHPLRPRPTARRL